MRILAIDTALANCSAAVLQTESGQMVSVSETIERGHAEMLMDMISQVMDHAGLAFADLDRIGVTIGPGSFTGVRVGLSTTRGLGLVLSKPAIGVTTLAALAVKPRETTPKADVAAVIDARRGEIYAQLFAADGSMTEPTVTTLESYARLLPQGTVLIGSAAPALAEMARTFGRDLPVSGDDVAPPIEAVAHLTARSKIPETAPKPLYLRPPDAKPQTDQLLRIAAGR